MTSGDTSVAEVEMYLVGIRAKGVQCGAGNLEREPVYLRQHDGQRAQQAAGRN